MVTIEQNKWLEINDTVDGQIRILILETANKVQVLQIHLENKDIEPLEMAQMLVDEIAETVIECIKVHAKANGQGMEA